ncbi:hypothetical protein LINGRAHAP2_LOCUS36512 [Linum grandiflorum]
MAPRRKNQEIDLSQSFVEEKQVAAGDAGHVGSSSNLVREEVPPQSAPTADLGGTVASLLQMMEGSRKLMLEDRQMMEENHQSLEGRLINMSFPLAGGRSSQSRQENFSPLVNNQPSPHRPNRGDSSATIHVEGPNDVGMRELPPRGKIFAPTFNIPVHQPPMHGVCQPPPISMARTYVASGHLGWGVGLSGGDHILSHAYPRPMPPQFNGQGMNPMRFMLPAVQQEGHGHDANTLREQVAQLLNEQFGIDNFKANLIFDHFYKYGQVKLTGGYNIPPPKKLKAKNYCRWHNSMSHSIEHCMIFCNVFHNTIQKGHVKFPEPKKDDMLVDTNPFRNVLGINMVKLDFSKVEWPHFKQVLGTTPPSQATLNVAYEQGASSSDMQANLTAFVVSSIADKLYLCCNTSLTFDEDPRLGPALRPWYSSYQTQWERVRQPVLGQPRQWTGYDSHPMRKMFRIPTVPPRVWYTYDSRIRRLIAIAEMTGTQNRKFLRKNVQACWDHYAMISSKVVGASLMDKDFEPRITMDYSMAIGLKVTMTNKSQHVQVQSEVDMQGGHGSLPHKEMKKNCLARGHINDEKSRQGDMTSTTNDGQESVSNKAQHVQTIRGCGRHASIVMCEQWAMRLTMKNRVRGIFKSMEQTLTPHTFNNLNKASSD